MLHPVGHGPDDRQRPPKPLLRTMLGDVLRRTRLEQGRTLADVAGAAKVSVQYLSELERGRKEASSEILAAICDALWLELPELLAAVGRGLAGAADRQVTVVRLGSMPDRRASSYLPGSGDVRCLLAA